MRVLTWNISLTDPSFQAPSDWDRSLNMFEIHKIIEDENPDIFSLQEIPSVQFGKRFTEYNYVEPVASHSGLVGVFVKKTLKVHQVITVPPCIAVEISELTTEGAEKNHFFFVGCHLFPFKQNAEIRIEQIGNLLQALKDVSDKYPIIIAGDMNMRENETKNMISTYDLDDAYWKT
ncbi:MAG: endonuclease/exonuclease/phosphatase family protein [Candidatus Kariarchaeaceae archaeon]|jgi:endonuclease/exonuclease/phosphatase family metal-dependent hydrolase